ncbi:MAG: SDR family NAD(P)-dependent oxidoreductase [Chromatocurvus sp.]
MGRLQGKVAVILGASEDSSMGAATARRFAAEGAKLILAARRKEAVEAVASPLGAVAVACDITREEDIEMLAATAVDHFGQLDIAINYSGFSEQAPVAEVTAEALRRSSDVHFVGTTLFFKHMGARMADGGAMITASSMTCLLAPAGLAAYAGAKAGADQVARIAAVEHGKRGIRVNAIAPGFTRSAMTEGFFQIESVPAAFLREVVLDRLVTVEDIANTALWLSSDEAFITGQVIDMSGGQTLNRIPFTSEMV